MPLEQAPLMIGSPIKTPQPNPQSSLSGQRQSRSTIVNVRTGFQAQVQSAVRIRLA